MSMKIDIDGLRRNIANITSELGEIIDDLPSTHNHLLRATYEQLASEVWALANMSGDLDKPLKSLDMSIYKFKEIEAQNDM